MYDTNVATYSHTEGGREKESTWKRSGCIMHSKCERIQRTRRKKREMMHSRRSFTEYKVLNKQMKCLLNYVPRTLQQTIMFVMLSLSLSLSSPSLFPGVVIVVVHHSFVHVFWFGCVLFFLLCIDWMLSLRIRMNRWVVRLMRTTCEYTFRPNMYLCHTAPTPSANVLMFLYMLRSRISPNALIKGINRKNLRQNVT